MMAIISVFPMKNEQGLYFAGNVNVIKSHIFHFHDPLIFNRSPETDGFVKGE